MDSQKNRIVTESNRVGDESLADAVLERVRPEMAALDTNELVPIKLDLSGAVATVLGVLPEVRALRAQIVKELPSFDIARFDKLEDYAIALGYTHAKFLSATQTPDDLDELASEAQELRERLLAEVRALVQHGIVSGERLSQLKGARGYKNIATDLMVITNVLRETWPRIEGKVFTTVQDLDTALKTSTRLLRIVGLREQAPAQVAEAMELRVRAFTLLLVAYEDVRRAIAYLRADAGDADAVAPSLFLGRPRPRRATDSEESMPTVPPAPVAPTAQAEVPVSAVPVAGPFMT